jgi:photosystem II stability/assembly factor-like uncharacterized protein
VVSVAGDYAYVIDNILNLPDWLRVIDISDPGSPVEVGAHHLQGDVYALAVSGDYLYAAAYDLGLLVLDISNPQIPVEVGSYTVPSALDVVVAGDYAYLASPAAQGGFLIFDITDPADPALVSSYSPAGFSPFDVALDGDFAYLTEPTGNLLHLMHVGNPTSPVELGTYTAPGDLFNVFAQDSLVYVVDGSAGLLILENDLYSIPGGGVAWEPQSSGTTENLRGVYFVDAAIGWVVGDDGTVLSTQDGGENWLPQTSGTGENLFAVYFADAMTGWIAGRAGVIRKTTDGGDTWVAQNSGTSEQIRDLQFVNHAVGWAVGSSGVIRKTIDGGENWQSQASGTSEILESVSFVDALHGWVAGLADGLTLRTADGGDHWQAVYIPGGGYLSSVSFVDEQVGWVASWAAAVFKTTDGGTTWFEQHSDPETPYSGLNDIFFIDLDHGWVVGADALEGRSWSTTDSGNTWTEMHGGREHYLQSVHFVDPYNGWAVGHDGTILRATSPLTSVSEGPVYPVAGADQALLYGNYPNPFNPATSIVYELPERASVSLKIYNILGQEVRTLVDHIESPGYKSIVWDGLDSQGQTVGSGVYLYKLRVGNEVTSKKMMLLR